MRLDVFLTERGLAPSRQRAKLLIESGCVLLNGKVVEKPSAPASESDKIEIIGEPLAYVSRGALKLERAFEAFSLSAADCTAIDVGASTGGFTEYLLLQGAAHVYAVDSGSGQLAEKLRRDARVVSMEKHNARFLSPTDFPVRPTFAVMDVSFISQTLILPALYGVLDARAILVSLVKPQFEAGREAIGKGGVVKSRAARAGAISRVVEAAKACGFAFCGVTPSPILGGDGNEEFLACFSKGGERPAVENEAQSIARAAGMQR